MHWQLFYQCKMSLLYEIAIIVSVWETQHIIIIPVPYHKGRIDRISVAVLSIDFFASRHSRNTRKRFACFLLFRALWRPRCKSKTTSFSAFIQRNNMLWKILRLMGTQSAWQFFNHYIFLRRSQFRRLDDVCKHNDFSRFKRTAYAVIIVILFLI